MVPAVSDVEDIMRHKAKCRKLGRSTAHRKATVAALVRNLIREDRITTTVTKAKEARSLAEKMVTVARKGTLAARRQVIAILSDGDHVAKLFDSLVPQFEGRAGGYTRIAKLGRRRSDSSEMAVLEWLGAAPPEARKSRKEKTEKE